MDICFTVDGVKHCIPIPQLIEKIHFPPPHNFPELELAVTVLELARVAPASPIARELTQVSTRFIQNLAQQLPKGVELNTQTQAG